MLFAKVIFSGWNWLWFAGAALLFGIILVGWAYRRAPGRLGWICGGLKAAGLLALVVCLLEPLWSGQRAKPGANLFAIVADNSQGMQIKASGSGRSRGDIMKALLDPEKNRWPGVLEEGFELRRYQFDTRLEGVNGFEAMTFDGRGTSLGLALRQVASRFRDRPLAGVLLFTDGNATDLRGLPGLAGLPAIFPVIPGGREAVRDLGIQQVRATQTVFEDAPVSIEAEVRATDCRGETAVGQLVDAAGKVVGEQSHPVRQEGEQLVFRYRLRPEGQGLVFYRFRVGLKGEATLEGSAGPTREATLINNSSVVAVDRGRGPYRVLYVSGRPNWDFKFLNRALEEDKQLQLVALIRVAKREPRFAYLGRAGETSNPLFRGFGGQSPEEVERYDQPVLVRLNTRDEMELRGGFPKTAEELFSYHAVILDDVESAFFTADQAALVQRFVSERGGGLLMLGGMESFQEGNYHRTPIGDMLPVYLDRQAGGQGEAARLDLTREGWLQSWARLRDNEEEERKRLKGLPGFEVVNRVGGVKPGASVILSGLDAAGEARPVLVVQRFGRGRTAALTVGDMWRWGFQDADLHRDMDKAWRQLTRWLVNEVPGRVELVVEPQEADSSGAVRMEVRVREPDFRPADDARVTIAVAPALDAGGSAASTNRVSLQAEAAGSEAGMYEAVYVPRASGGYQATAVATNSAGESVGLAVAGWSSDPAAEEFRSLSPNMGLLQAIARQTGGEVIAAEELERFVRELPRRKAPVMEAWTFPLWHTPAMFGFALVCLTAEWGLRRWKGMP